MSHRSRAEGGGSEVREMEEGRGRKGTSDRRTPRSRNRTGEIEGDKGGANGRETWKLQAHGAEIQGPPVKVGNHRDERRRSAGGGATQVDSRSAPGIFGW